MSLTRSSKRLVIRVVLVTVPLLVLAFFWVRTHVWKADRLPDPGPNSEAISSPQNAPAQPTAIPPPASKPYRPVVIVDYRRGEPGPSRTTYAVLNRAFFATQQLVSPDGRSLTQFPQSLQAALRDLPELEVSTAPDKPVWNNAYFPEATVRFMAFKFRSPLTGPADLYWTFTTNAERLHWQMLDLEQEEFVAPSEHPEARFPRFRAPSASLNDSATFQAATGGKILPGHQYLIWFLRPASQADEQFEALYLEPAPADPDAADRRKEDLKTLGKRVDEEYVRVEVSIALRLIPAGSEPVVSGPAEIAERIGLPLDASPGSRIVLRSPGEIKMVRVTSDGRRIAVSGSGNVVRLHELESGALVWEFRLDGPCDAIEISPDGRLLVAAVEGSTRIAVRNLATGEALSDIELPWAGGSTPPGPAGRGEIAALRFDGGPKHLAVRLRAADGPEPRRGEFVLWDLEAGREVQRVPLDAGTMFALPRGAEELLVMRPRQPAGGGNRMELALVDRRSGKGTVTAGLGESLDIRHACLSPSGALIAWDAPQQGAFDFFVADSRSGQTVSRFSTVLREQRQLVTRARAVGWSPDSRFVALALGNHSIQVWDIPNDRLVAERHGHLGEVRSLAFTPDGRRLISGSEDGTVRVWPHDPSPPDAMTDSLGIALVPLPAADFLMGTPGPRSGNWRETAGSKVERPRHTVRISRPFFIARYETTVAQFREFVEATGYRTTVEASGTGGEHVVNVNRGHVTRPDFIWSSPGFPQEASHPVVQVSYDDAQAFCRWLSAKEQATYRLPTEAEWEYASRAGGEGETWNARMYGHNDKPAHFYGNVADVSAQRHYKALEDISRWDDGYVWTAPVGSFSPNGFGLYDMNGNVFEWCLDFYNEGYYQSSPFLDPLSVDPNQREDEKYVQRGGGFLQAQAKSCCSHRNYGPRTEAQSSLGFRVVREFPAAKAAGREN